MLTFEDVINSAIERENEAAKFYRKIAEEAFTESLKKVFLEFAIEEEKHRDRLIAIRDGEFDLGDLKKEVNLKIGEYIVSPTAVTDEVDYKQALKLAMSREKSSFRFYSELGQKVTDKKVKELFFRLAQEEAKHKLTLEVHIDDFS